MIYRHTQEQIDDYYERIGINQSSLKALLKDGIEKFLIDKDQLMNETDTYYGEKEYFIIGSAVDCNITQGEEVFKNKYYISQLTKKLGDKSMSVTKLAFDKAKTEFPTGPDSDMKLYAELIWQACEKEGYYANQRKSDFREDKRIDRLIKEGANSYWTELLLSEGKQLLSVNENNTIQSIIMSLTTHPHTRHLFQDAKDTDIVYQFPMYWTYKDVDCKALPDMIIINYTRKTIYLIDIKTTMELVTRFNRVIRQRRYDLQGSFYNFGASQSIKELSEVVGKSLEGFEIAKFAFIAESTTKPGCPLIFPLTDSLLELGKNGDISKGIGGWEQGIELYKQWGANDFNIMKGLSKTHGVLFVDQEYNYTDAHLLTRFV